MPSARLSVTVAVIAYNEAANIGACLESLCALDYPRELMETLVIDNNSTDATRDVARGFAGRLSNLKIIVNPRRGTGASRNVALREATRDFLAFTDADCVVFPDWLSNLDSAMREARSADSKVAGVGGPNIAPENCNRFRQAVEVGVRSYWGNQGSIQGAVPGELVLVDHLPTLNVLYDRKLALNEGGFDEKMGSIAEDVDLSYRLRWRGYKLLFVPKAIVRHKWRTDARSWARNMIVYGKGRIWLMKKDLRFFSLMRVAPLGLLAMTILIVVIPWPLYLLPLFYLFLTAVMAVAACLKAERMDLVLDVFIFFVLTHFAYGVGEVVGLVQPRGAA